MRRLAHARLASPRPNKVKVAGVGTEFTVAFRAPDEGKLLEPLPGILPAMKGGAIFLPGGTIPDLPASAGLGSSLAPLAGGLCESNGIARAEALKHKLSEQRNRAVLIIIFSVSIGWTIVDTSTKPVKVLCRFPGHCSKARVLTASHILEKSYHSACSCFRFSTARCLLYRQHSLYSRRKVGTNCHVNHLRSPFSCNTVPGAFSPRANSARGKKTFPIRCPRV